MGVLYLAEQQGSQPVTAQVKSPFVRRCLRSRAEVIQGRFPTSRLILARALTSLLLLRPCLTTLRPPTKASETLK